MESSFLFSFEIVNANDIHFSTKKKENCHSNDVELNSTTTTTKTYRSSLIIDIYYGNVEWQFEFWKMFSITMCVWILNKGDDQFMIVVVVVVVSGHSRIEMAFYILFFENIFLLSTTNKRPKYETFWNSSLEKICFCLFYCQFHSIRRNKKFT